MERLEKQLRSDSGLGMPSSVQVLSSGQGGGTWSNLGFQVLSRMAGVGSKTNFHFR